jgi:hypothetical protein
MDSHEENENTVEWRRLVENRSSISKSGRDASMTGCESEGFNDSTPDVGLINPIQSTELETAHDLKRSLAMKKIPRIHPLYVVLPLFVCFILLSSWRNTSDSPGFFFAYIIAFFLGIPWSYIFIGHSTHLGGQLTLFLMGLAALFNIVILVTIIGGVFQWSFKKEPVDSHEENPKPDSEENENPEP